MPGGLGGGMARTQALAWTGSACTLLTLLSCITLVISCGAAVVAASRRRSWLYAGGAFLHPLTSIPVALSHCFTSWRSACALGRPSNRQRRQSLCEPPSDAVAAPLQADARKLCVAWRLRAVDIQASLARCRHICSAFALAVLSHLRQVAARARAVLHSSRLTAPGGATVSLSDSGRASGRGVLACALLVASRATCAAALTPPNPPPPSPPPAPPPPPPSSLVAFAAALTSGSTLSSWSGAFPCSGLTTSTWTGVTCAAGNVTAITLSGLSLNGSISCAVATVTTLARLDLVRQLCAPHATAPL